MRCSCEDGWVAGFDGGVDATGFGVGWEDGGDEVGKLGVCLNVWRNEKVGFVGDMGEDEGGSNLGVVTYSTGS